jgi:hypothetical protein
METHPQSRRQQVLLFHLQLLLIVLPLMCLLVLVFAFPFTFSSYVQDLAWHHKPQCVVVPVVFVAGLACFLEVVKGTVFVLSCCFTLANHVQQILTQPHCICLTGLALGFWHGNLLEETFALVILHEVIDIRVLNNFRMLKRVFSLIVLLQTKAPWCLQFIASSGLGHGLVHNTFGHAVGQLGSSSQIFVGLNSCYT